MEQALTAMGLPGIVIFALGATVVALASFLVFLLKVIFKLYEQRIVEAAKVQEITVTLSKTVESWVDKISEVKR